ncbi:MAG: hypothetical protein ACYDBH_21410, partial [Acidobacteriaceae bacterium]
GEYILDLSAIIRCRHRMMASKWQISSFFPAMPLGEQTANSRHLFTVWLLSRISGNGCLAWHAFSPGNIHHVSKSAMTSTKTGGDHALSGNSNRSCT